MATKLQRLRSNERALVLHNQILRIVKAGGYARPYLEAQTSCDVAKLVSFHMLVGRDRKEDNIRALLHNVSSYTNRRLANGGA